MKKIIAFFLSFVICIGQISTTSVRADVTTEGTESISAENGDENLEPPDSEENESSAESQESLIAPENNISYNEQIMFAASNDTGITTVRFDYTGDVQTFTAPYDGEYTLTVAGAQGGSTYGTGGNGGTSTGKIILKKGEVLQIYVGNQPADMNSSFNGGGGGWYSAAVGGGASSGGGATDIRKDGDSLDNRIIVAGGGGGGAIYYGTSVYGGSGGGLEAGPTGYIRYTGTISIGWTSSIGATQTSSFKYNEEPYRCNETSMATNLPNRINITYPYSGTNIGWVEAILAAKGIGNITSGGGYYGGADLVGNNMIAGGFGGSGYIGGVTEGSMTTGTNSGNGWATITYTNEYNVTYIGNGGISSDGSSTFIEGAIYGSNYTIKSGNIFARTGYTFTGWNEKADGSGKSYKAGDTFKYDSLEGMTLYAQWSYDTVKVSVPQCLIGDKNGNSSFIVKSDIKAGNIVVTVPDGFYYKQSGKDDVYAKITAENNTIMTKDNQSIKYTISTDGLSSGCWNGSFNIDMKLNE